MLPSLGLLVLLGLVLVPLGLGGVMVLIAAVMVVRALTRDRKPPG